MPKRIAEKLVLEGYRRWCAWVVTEDDMHWRTAREHFIDKLGNKQGHFALSLFVELMSTLRENASGPLRSRGFGCESLCFHEVLMLGLFSGIQHDEETSVTLCIDALLGNGTSTDIIRVRAEAFAHVLLASDKQLYPIPANTIKTVLTETVSTDTLQ